MKVMAIFDELTNNSYIILGCIVRLPNKIVIKDVFTIIPKARISLSRKTCYRINIYHHKLVSINQSVSVPCLMLRFFARYSFMSSTELERFQFREPSINGIQCYETIVFILEFHQTAFLYLPQSQSREATSMGKVSFWQKMTLSLLIFWSYVATVGQSHSKADVYHRPCPQQGWAYSHTSVHLVHKG